MRKFKNIIRFINALFTEYEEKGDEEHYDKENNMED